MARDPAFLRKLRITRIDRVADPANPDAVQVLYKAAGRAGLDDEVEAVLKAAGGALSRSQAVAQVLDADPGLYEPSTPVIPAGPVPAPTLRQVVEARIVKAASAAGVSVSALLTRDPAAAALYALGQYDAATMSAAEAVAVLKARLGDRHVTTALDGL